MLRRIAAISSFASCLFLAGCSNPTIDLVKNGILDSCPGVTVGEMVDSFIGNPRWESGRADDGGEFVNIKGNVEYLDKQVDMVLQYSVNKDNDRFQFNALEFNGVPQPGLISYALVSKMCDEAKK